VAIPKFRLEADAFVIENYNDTRTFSSFLPGIAGELGKPLWLFYTNRGQCVSSFGVRDKNGAMLEFYPANKAYNVTPIMGFRTFLRAGSGSRANFQEAFRSGNVSRQIMRIRPHEIELEELFPGGLSVSSVVFNAPNENLPFLIRDIRFANEGKRPIDLEVVDGLPQIAPFGLNDWLLKHMSRTMEAFAEVRHSDKNLPFYKLKVEPSDKPEVQWIEGGFFAFSSATEPLADARQRSSGGRCLKMIVDPAIVFGEDTSFTVPRLFQSRRNFASLTQRTESLTASAFSTFSCRLAPGKSFTIHSFYGQSNSWQEAASLRERLLKDPEYTSKKREENRSMIRQLTDLFPLHTGDGRLDAYTRQAFLDNILRGGRPIAVTSEKNCSVFHYFSRKHGDMERDYNFFEVSPGYFSQGSGNFRDVNQNRRSEVMLFPDVHTANIETFFNLIQLDGFNPLIIQHEKFYMEPEAASVLEIFAGDKERESLKSFLVRPFSPGALFERLLQIHPGRSDAYQTFLYILGRSRKIQEAAHGEGFWVDHWTYNLDLLENYAAVYPDGMKDLFSRRDFTWFDSDHIVQPRSRKYVRRKDGSIRQLHAVVPDEEKRNLIRQRTFDPHKVRTRHGQGDIYGTTLLVKVLGIIGIKAASLDPFGIGIEMEADRPGWCDALNGLPALFGSSSNESFELKRLAVYVQDLLPVLFGDGGEPSGAAVMPVELAELLTAVTGILSAPKEDFFETWDALASLKEQFRERTRLGIDGEERGLNRGEIETFLAAVIRTLEAGLSKAFRPDGLCVTYFIHEVTRWEAIPAPAQAEAKPALFEHVRALEFRQQPVTPFLEGPVHGLRTIGDREKARRLYRAVKNSGLYDRSLKMFRLNLPLDGESDEIGREKIFTPGWLENESVFLHMAYKFMLETLRSGLAEEFFADLRGGLVAFQDPARYGRSILENSSFIASSRFPDIQEHGRGFVARLTGATAEWISMVLYMGLGARPFQWKNGKLIFEPKPAIAGWLFNKKAAGEFEKNTFGFRLMGQTWIVYRNPSRRNTFGDEAVQPVRFDLLYEDGRVASYDGAFLPDPFARELREGKLSRLTIDLA
jgi:hypothetical protein